MFICPVCKNELNKTGKSLICSNGHCFDMAKSGYVNLLLKSTGGNHGDNKLMVSARHDFLDKGYYEPLREAIVKMCREFTDTGDIIVDCGCGEGYYTSKIAEVLPDRTVCGFDISKDALAVAAKRNKTVEYAVASSFDIPLPDSCADMITEIFSPHSEKEFLRILKPDGRMLMVIPLENHLLELKQAVYDKAYKNEPSSFEIEGFKLLKSERVEYTADIACTEDIKNLFAMTPYYYKTGEKEQARLNTLQRLNVTLSFAVLCYGL